MAKARLKVFKRSEDSIDRVETSREGLVGLHYEPLFPYSHRCRKRAFRVVQADFVSTEDGTGIVHIAPGFGEDDYQLGQREGLPTVAPIDEDCCFTEEVSDYVGALLKVDRDIIRALRDSGKLLVEARLSIAILLLAL